MTILTVKALEAMKPGEIFVTNVGKILHPWFNDAVKTVDKDGMADVRWIAVRGKGYYDWSIYHSLSFETARYLDGTSHLSKNIYDIRDMGAKLTNKNDIRNLVPCDDTAFSLYRF